MLLKKPFYFLFTVFLSGALLMGCSHSVVHTNDNGDGQPDETENHDDFGKLTFTARGETVTCTPSENQAAFIHDFHGSNYLTIYGINRDLPTNNIYSIGVDLLIQGELKPGTYQFTDAETFAHCLDDKSGCDGICKAGVIAKKLEILPNGKENPDMTADKKFLSSTGGTLKITSVTIGKYGEGFAKGKISGSFSFSGTNLFKLSGNAEGKFEDIPLVSTK